MHGLAIGQYNDAQKPVLHFRHLRPTPDAAVGLDHFPNRRSHRFFDPFVPDDSPIRPLTDCCEVVRNLHGISVSDFLLPGSASVLGM